VRSKIFHARERYGQRVALASLLSLLLFWASLQGFGRVLESKLATLVTPIHYLMDAPIRGFHWLATSTKTQHDLLIENAQLRAHQFLLESKVHRLLSLQNENEQLKQLNESAQKITTSVQATRLIAVSLDPALHEWLINSGRLEGVQVGQPVLDAFGVVGQIKSVADHSAKVLLLTDPKGAIAVQNSRTGERAIAVGIGEKNQLVLKSVEKTADIQPSDWYISSGLAQRFPFGYPVGQVQTVDKDNARQFLSVNLRVAAHLDSSNQLLLVKVGDDKEGQSQ
jgi:rod shape-determining protein MreC